MNIFDFKSNLKLSLASLVGLLMLGGCSATCIEETITVGGGVDNGYTGVNEVGVRRSTNPAIPPGAPDRNFDVAGNDDGLVTTLDFQDFIDNHGPITGATLIFELKPGIADSEATNDNIQIYPYHFANLTLGGAPIAGANLWHDPIVIGPNHRGIEPWAGYSNSTVFTIDLTNFPSDLYNRHHGGQRTTPSTLLSGVPRFIPAGQAGAPTTPYQLAGGYDLTRIMNQRGYIDLYIGDDSNVDYIKLIITRCTCQ